MKKSYLDNKKIIKVNPDDYEFDEIEEIKDPARDAVRLKFKKKGKILVDTIIDGIRWAKWKETPSVIFNESERFL